MRCAKCGKEIDSKASFCSYCGTAIDNRHAEEVNKEYAISSMILGIMSLFLLFANLPFSIVAIVLASKGQGNRYAKIGRITGIVGLVLSIISLAVGILLLVLFALGVLGS